MKIYSWNVNGIRAVSKKGFAEWFKQESPDVLCVQETKAKPEQLDASLRQPEGYFSYFNSAEKKGYSGVALFSKQEPLRVNYKLEEPRFDCEGRMIEAEYTDFVLFNVYFPNGKMNNERLKYKLAFYETFLQHVLKLRAKKIPVIITGDVNTAHREIDLAHPKQNEKTSGFLPIERQWIDRLLAEGFIDVFRHFYPDKVEYSWWDYRTRARSRNVGWRIDYFIVSEGLENQVTNFEHLTAVMGSDHCPLKLTLT